MDRKLRLLVVCGTLAVGLLVSGVVSAEESPAVELKAPALVVESAPQADVCLPEAEANPLEELDQAGKPVSSCYARCGGYPYVNCTQICGDYAACSNGWCMYL